MGNVLGRDALVAKSSAVDARGEWRRRPIAGLEFRTTRPVPHEDGHVAEVARADWDIIGGPVVQVHTTTTFAGRIRAWGLHQRSTDRLFVVTGLVRIVVFDGRVDKNPGLLVVPPNLYHGWKNIGTTEAVIINMPTELYAYDAPDALDLPWDSPEAAEIIPYSFAPPLV